MRSSLRLAFLVLLAGFYSAVSASAQTSLYLEDLRTNQTIAYEFGAFEAPNVLSFSSSGVETNIPASSDSFGGLGVEPALSLIHI